LLRQKLPKLGTLQPSLEHLHVAQIIDKRRSRILKQKREKDQQKLADGDAQAEVADGSPEPSAVGDLRARVQTILA
jgi:hypothetical protein